MGHSKGKNMNTIKTYGGTSSDVNKKVCLEVNAGKTKYMSVSRHQNAEQYHNIKIANKSVENV
jgi:hypothetical protein